MASQVTSLAGRDPRPKIDDDSFVAMGAHLREFRTRLGWTRRYAAARLGIFEAQLEEWEQGVPIRYKRYKQVMGRYRRAQHYLTRRLGRLD